MENNLFYKIFKVIIENPKLLSFFSLILFGYIAVLIYCLKKKTRFAKSVRIGLLSSVIPWFLMINPIRQSYHSSEGWQKGLAISFGIIETFILSALVFFILTILTYFIEAPHKN